MDSADLYRKEVLSLTKRILNRGLDCQEVLKDTNQPGLLELAAQEILDMAKMGEVDPYLAIALDDMISNRVKYVRYDSVVFLRPRKQRRVR